MQVHKGPPMTVEFKNIQIKHLPDDLPLHSLEQNPIPSGSKGVRPQGRLPDGWKAPKYLSSLSLRSESYICELFRINSHRRTNPFFPRLVAKLIDM